MVIKLNRILKRAFEHIKATKWISLATVLVIFLSFTVSGIVLFLTVSLQKTVKEFSSRPRIYVYFQPSAEEEDILEIKSAIEKNSLVANVDYISQEQAAEELKKRLGTDTNVKINDMVSLLPPSLNIQPASLNDVEKVVVDMGDLLDGNPIVDEIRYSADAIRNLQAISTIVMFNGYMIIGLAIAVSVLLVYVAINFAVKYYTEELKIMNVLGSERKMLTLPFVFEALLYGVSGGALAGIAMTAFILGNKRYIYNDEVLRSFVSINNLSQEINVISINEILTTLGITIGIGIFLGVIICGISGSIAVVGNLKHVKKGKR